MLYLTTAAPLTTAERLLEDAYDLVSAFGLKLIELVIILIVGIKLIHWVAKKVGKMKFFDNLDTNLRSFVKSGVEIILYALLIIICAGILGINTTSFITVLASCGVAVGLALQGALSNVAGGIMILVFHPFHVGDYVSAAGVDGTVHGVTLFYTFLETVDNKEITIPNGNITGSTITNFSVKGNRRVDLDFNVAYNSDLQKVKELMLAVAAKHEKVLQDPAPFARLSKQGECALTFTLRVWCKNADYWDVYFDMLENMKLAFDQEGICIPYPQMDVHVKEK